MNRRTAAFVLLTLGAIVVAGGYVGKAALSGRAAADQGGANLGGHERPVLVFQRTSGDEYGRVGFLPLAGNPRQTVTKLACERVHFAGARGLCLTPDKSALGWVYQARVFGSDFRVQRAVSLPGLISRARVSPDGRYGATTGFVTGHSYADDSFSVQTFILDLAGGKKIANLEDFAVYHRGREVTAEDRNFWGVTFAADSNRFYVTMATGGKIYLVEGDIRHRRGRTIHENVECPSISPDGTRIAYKGVGWRLSVLDLATGREWRTGETRSIDDQVEWLDNERIVYGHDGATWTVPADGSDAPRKLIDGALSPAVVREVS